MLIALLALLGVSLGVIVVVAGAAFLIRRHRRAAASETDGGRVPEPIGAQALARPDNWIPRVLFVHYSFSQNTARVADTMESRLRERGWDVSEALLDFTDPHYGKRFADRPMRFSVVKIVSMLPAQLRRKTGDVGIPEAAATGEYDLVVIGSPTWWLTTCMPVRSYLHDPASAAVMGSTPFATFTTSRRYYKNNLRTMRELGETNGGSFVADTHFVSDGNQVTSMWSWLVFMRHDVEKRRSFGMPLPKPNLKQQFEEQATEFIDGVAASVLGVTRDGSREADR